MTNIIEKYNKPFEYTGIIMHLIMACQFLKLWYMPSFEDAEKIYALAVLMAFEFVLMHSGVFMAVTPKKISLFILAPIYGIFAWAFSQSMPDNSILVIYGLIILNRMRFAFSDVSNTIKNKSILTSVLGAVAYFILIFVCLFTNSIFGEMGVTPAFLEKSGYFNHVKSGGAFIDTPHIALGFGFFYYSTLAIVQALLLQPKRSVNFNKIPHA